MEVLGAGGIWASFCQSVTVDTSVQRGKTAVCCVPSRFHVLLFGVRWSLLCCCVISYILGRRELEWEDDLTALKVSLPRSRRLVFENTRNVFLLSHPNIDSVDLSSWRALFLLDGGGRQTRKSDSFFSVASRRVPAQ
ncbi:unnamed protein product, partial [Ectocarpus sp. 8 AP-2014]